MRDKKAFCSEVPRALFVILFFLLLPSFLFSGVLNSPSWGFSLDLPEGYEYIEGDAKDRFSFGHPNGAKFDLIVYYAPQGRQAPYSSVEEMAKDIHTRLNNKGEWDAFEYRQKKAILMEMLFTISGSGLMSGWALCMELGEKTQSTAKPLLMAIAYGPRDRDGLQQFHLSALDSLAPEDSDRRAPGPITEFGYPRVSRVLQTVFGLDMYAWIYEEDAEGAQYLIDREFQILRNYQDAPDWKEAWERFYRAIYRDSYERLTDIAFRVERKMNVPSKADRDFAEDVLNWVQTFTYERELMGSDFINLISAATMGKGDCDNRSMLWAIVLIQANIPAAMMVSRNYGHAMGLADLPGYGARFELGGQRLLVAETVAKVSLGLIGETVSEREHWLGIQFE